MALDFQTHKYRKKPGTNLVELEKVNPYVRMGNGEDAYIYLQAGKCYAGGGEMLDLEDVPGWVWEKMKKMDHRVLKEVGWYDQLNDALIAIGDKPAEPPKKATERGKWVCKQCEEEMDKNMRLAHTMAHRREEKAAQKAKEE